MKKYELTPTHRAQLGDWHRRWVRIAMRTDPQTEEDRAAMIEAINGLYDAASLERPKHIVFAPSPLVGRVASGFAAAIWWLHDNRAAPATRAATEAATEAATWAATEAATGDGWAKRLAYAIAPAPAAVDLLCSCASAAMKMYVGGNMWAPGVDFISFFRHVANLTIDYSKWRHYEAAAVHGGFRFMHPKFCIVVDFPERLLVDEARRPHCADGPSHRWRDGFEIYHWHGLRISPEKSWIITDKARITAEAIMAEENAELRRVMCEVSEWRPLLSRAREISADTDGNGNPRRLLSVRVGNDDLRILDVMNGSLEPDGTRRRFLLGAMPGNTPHAAVAASYGVNPAAYREAVRT